MWTSSFTRRAGRPGSRADHGGAFWGSVGNEFSLKRLNFSSKAQNWKEEYRQVQSNPTI